MAGFFAGNWDWMLLESVFFHWSGLSLFHATWKHPDRGVSWVKMGSSPEFQLSNVSMDSVNLWYSVPSEDIPSNDGFDGGHKEVFGWYREKSGFTLY